MRRLPPHFSLRRTVSHIRDANRTTRNPKTSMPILGLNHGQPKAGIKSPSSERGGDSPQLRIDSCVMENSSFAAVACLPFFVGSATHGLPSNFGFVELERAVLEQKSMTCEFVVSGLGNSQQGHVAHLSPSLLSSVPLSRMPSFFVLDSCRKLFSVSRG